MTKQLKQPTDVVKCTWSGNRANAFDTDGNKRTSEITTGARQKAADGGCQNLNGSIWLEVVSEERTL